MGNKSPFADSWDLAKLKEILNFDVGAYIRQLQSGEKRKEADDTIDEADKKKLNHLFLYIRPDEWLWLLRDPNGNTLQTKNAWVPPDVAHEGLKVIFKAAISDINSNNSLVKELQDVVLLLEDPAILYFVGRGIISFAKKDSDLRKIGSQLLNVKRATFGQQKLDELPILAFADTEKLTQYLGCIDSIAPMVCTVVPLGALILNHASALAHNENPGCVVHLSHQHTYVALANTEMGIAMVRTLPVGVAGMITALAEANGLPPLAARKKLEERDFLSTLPVNRAAEIDDPLKYTATEIALVPIMDDLLKALSETFDYFSEQCVGGTVKRIHICYSAGIPKGFTALMQEHLGVETEVDTLNPLELLANQPTQPLANLLAGAEGPLVTVGKVAFTFKLGKMEPMSPLELKAINSQQRVIRHPSNPNKHITELSNNIWSKFYEFFQVNDPGETSAEKQQTIIGHVIFAMVMALLLYFGWDWYVERDIAHKGLLSTASTTLTTNIKLRNELGIGGGEIDRALADKVLWTEKFLSLSKHINETVWLTDVFLTDDEKQVGNQKISGKKMVLEGAVLPSTDGHILEISKFIRKLQNDQNGFMSDFREIQFDGAHIDTSEADRVVRFRVEAIYDATKRVTRVYTPNAANDKSFPLEKTQDSVKAHINEAESLLKGGVNH